MSLKDIFNSLKSRYTNAARLAENDKKIEAHRKKCSPEENAQIEKEMDTLRAQLKARLKNK